MPTKKQDIPTFRELSDQLEETIAKLQRDDLDVDEALDLYQQGTKLTDQLEARLKSAEHNVRQLKPKSS